MKFLWLVMFFGLSLNLQAANNDPCKDVQPNSARGTCRAYWNACANDGNANAVACLRLRELWTERTGLSTFPWENPPPPPVTCPCSSAEPTFADMLSGAIPVDSCTKDAVNIQLFKSIGSPACQVFVAYDPGSAQYYCHGGCSDYVRSSLEGLTPITADEAARCYLDLEAVADNAGVSCTGPIATLK